MWFLVIVEERVMVSGELVIVMRGVLFSRNEVVFVILICCKKVWWF